ncbi:ATP-dependent protease [Pleurostoma richardsiae]|uniref:ATP-dependent protease n=1 Tax=Pleurostoma richardsiae TaxID=41990 RepID=A0AA38VGV0_9PEZI|nr:ATP-dependent protease [Pleurostoma richardsiae]
MSSPQDTEASTRSPSPLSEVADRLRRSSLKEDDLLRADQVRQIVRLFQCPRCSYPFHDPVTLPCGRTLCRGCLPETHTRANISYPATENRLQGFKCPFPDCEKEHAIADCAVDVVLSKVLANVKSALEEARNGAAASKSSVNIIVKDPWAVAGISSLKEPDAPFPVPQGGPLVATYTLAEMGELDYLADVSYVVVSGTNGQAAHDIIVLDRLKKAVRTEMDCQVCYAMFFDPLTTVCGHTFCRHCAQRALDHAPYCPICRRPISTTHVDRQSSPSNDLIVRIITTLWPEDVEVRKQMVAAENLHEGSEFDVPIFVCTLAFPQMPTFLHVFEPRYRLMIRRALEGNRCFGMVLPKRPRSHSDNHFHELGTLLRIINVEFFPDGRSVIETIGVSRFRIVNHTLLDGYVVAKTEKVNDVGVAEEEELEVSETRRADSAAGTVTDAGEATSRPTALNEPVLMSPVTPRPEDIERMATRELMDFCIDFVRRRKEQSVRWLTARMLAIYGECPSDPAVLPWWLGSILPVREEEKYRLLGTSSVRERLKICCRWIVEWETSRW